MQWRALGRGAGVARYEVQLLHRHVELVAARVFEHQELAVLAGDLHHLQADVAAHAVFFVHDRRARAEVVRSRRIACGIDGGAAPAAFLPRALTEELRFGEHRDRRREDVEARPSPGATDSAKRASLSTNSCQPATGCGVSAMRAQHLEQHFASPGRIRGEQHPPGVVSQEMLEWRERPLGAQVHAPFLRRGGREVVPARRVFDLETLDVDAREGVEPRVQFFGREEQFVGSEDRPFDVVASLLVAFGDDRAPRVRRRRQIRRRRTPPFGR